MRFSADGEQLEVRLAACIVELFRRGKRVAAHLRSTRIGVYVTVAAHMPRALHAYAEWTLQRLVRWAGRTGPRTARLVEAILVARPHPQQGVGSCLGRSALARAMVWGACRPPPGSPCSSGRNATLCLQNKAAGGYWHVFDPSAAIWRLHQVYFRFSASPR